MANISLREAVKIFDVSRPTLTKALNSGKISGVRNGKGRWEISPSELSRIYHPRVALETNTGKGEQINFTALNTTTEVGELKQALELAELRAEAAEKLAQERADRIEDLRRMLPAPHDRNQGQSTVSEALKKWWPW